MKYLVISLMSGEHILAKSLSRKDYSSTFYYRDLNEKYGEIPSSDIMGITVH